MASYLQNLHGTDELKHNVFDFLRENPLRICAPLPDGQLTLIKHCWVSVDRLSPAISHTRGVLWRLGDVISPQRIPIGSCAMNNVSYQRNLSLDGLNDYQKERLFGHLELLSERRC